MNWREYIVSDPQVLRGKPCIKNTRIPVALILGYLAAGRDAAAIQREFPDMTPTFIAACLDYARDLAEFETIAAWVCGSWVIIGETLAGGSASNPNQAVNLRESADPRFPWIQVNTSIAPDGARIFCDGSTFSGAPVFFPAFGPGKPRMDANERE
jgi:uncharacterized protein (DUF433 family)